MLSHNYSFYFLISYSQEEEGDNSPPTILNSSATSTLGQPTDIQLEVSDNENNQLQLTIVNQPQFGTLGEMNTTTNTVTYTPNPDAIAGSDSFTYTVNDGTVDSQPATVTISIVGTAVDTVVNGTQPTGSEDIEQPSQVGNDTVSAGVGANTVVNGTQPTGSEDIEQPSQVGNDTVSAGVGANTVVNGTQPTGSEDIEQPSQVGNDTVGADIGTGQTQPTGSEVTNNHHKSVMKRYADTGTNYTQPTGSEDTEQPSQVVMIRYGTDTGTDTDLGLESLLGTQDETSVAGVGVYCC